MAGGRGDPAPLVPGMVVGEVTLGRPGDTTDEIDPAALAHAAAVDAGV
jgi:hypothetical protein